MQSYTIFDFKIIEWFIIVNIFIFGLVFWSFGSVLIWRTRWEINKEVLKWILYWRSECPHCKKKLSWYNLIPLFSWLLSGAKCWNCKSKISSFYPVLEIVSWFAFVISYFMVLNSWFELFSNNFFLYMIYYLVINWLLVLLLFYDILFFRVNTYFWLFLVLWTIFWQFFGYVWNFYRSFFGWIIFFIFFMFIYIFGKYYVRFRFWIKDAEWIWWWDVMIAYFVGLFIHFMMYDLSYTNLFYYVFIYTIISSVLWILFFVVSSIINKWEQWSSLPFLPAMIAWFWVLFFAWDYLFKILFV